MYILKGGGCLLITLCMLAMVAGCSPEVGSDDWCQVMKEKPKGDWTTNEAADYAKHCIIK
jgi:hypothetical protein